MDLDFDFESNDEESSDQTIIDKSFYNKIMEDADLAASILNIHPDVAFLCLQVVNFDLERLLSEYVLDNSTFLTTLNILPENVHKSQLMVRGEKKETMTCEVCYCDYPGDSMLSLPCGHFFCEGCWRDCIMSHSHQISNKKGQTEGQTEGQISYSIEENNPSESLDLTFNTNVLKCMESGCKSVILPSDVEMLCGKTAEKAFIQRFNQKSIDTAVLVKRCSNPKCKLLLNIDSIGPCGLVQCKCGAWTCWKCGGKMHAPLKCKDLANWKSKFKDAASVIWLLNNTKQCPKCKQLIEKNGGCNHMTCQNCKYEFCWYCGHEWSTHYGDPYSCISQVYGNVKFDLVDSNYEFDEGQIKTEKVVNEQIKTEKVVNEQVKTEKVVNEQVKTEKVVGEQISTEKVVSEQISSEKNIDEDGNRILKMFYAHKNAARKEKANTHELKAILLPMFENDDKVISKIFDTRNLGRRILKWSYAYEFYMDKNSANYKIFKYLQNQLEIGIEKLSFAMEAHYRNKNRIERAIKQVDLSIKSLLKHVDDERMNV